MKKHIIAVLITMTTAPSALADGFTAQISSDRPNVVLILAEDMTPRLGAYGDPNAVTPNIDELAKESVVFTHAFTMAGVCAPSRAGLITGVPQHATGLQHMRTATYSHPYLGVPPAWVKGYPELLRRAGYFTYVDTKTDYQFSNGYSDVGPFTLWDAHGNYSNLDDLRVPAAWQNYDLKGKPFYINFNPQITHESGLLTLENAPKAFRALPKIWDKLRSFYTQVNINPAELRIDPYWQDTSEVRKELALFYRNINVMDQQVGNIVARLKHDNLWDNTIVIFAADNGDGLPRHKREGYDSGTHVPLIMHVPEKYRPTGWKKSGEKDNRLVSFEDLAPTILGFTRSPVPVYMQGVNMSADNAPYREYVFSSRGRMDNVALRSYYVRSKDYQYVQNFDTTANGVNIDFRNALVTAQVLNSGHKTKTLSQEQENWFAEKPREELYDLRRDPWQLNNIADENSSIARVDIFREKLEQWRNQTNDTSIISEAQMVEDLQDATGRARITLAPVAEINPVTDKLFIVSRTEGASLGYSFDDTNWAIYTEALKVPKEVKTVAIKAVRYGWKESNTVHLQLNKQDGQNR